MIMELIILIFSIIFDDHVVHILNTNNLNNTSICYNNLCYRTIMDHSTHYWVQMCELDILLVILVFQQDI